MLDYYSTFLIVIYLQINYHIKFTNFIVNYYRKFSFLNYYSKTSLVREKKILEISNI